MISEQDKLVNTSPNRESASPNERPYWLAWSAIPGVGPETFNRVLMAFGSMAEAWRADVSQIARLGVKPGICKQIQIERPNIEPELLQAELAKADLEAVCLPDANYPTLLKEIASPPPVLYLRGTLPAGLMLAVVGTRRPTPYGRLMTERITRPLAEAGVVIVSGLALGIDTMAHAAAVAGGAPTVAVFASGVDEVYPRANEGLAREIIERGGAWLSEQPLRTPPLGHLFPLRNRIIAGLTVGTLVVEAGVDSGALITARLALEANREVLAVPGPATNEQSVGPNNLIKLGARVVTEASDVFNLFSLKATPRPFPQAGAATPEEASLLQLLSREALHVDQLIERSNMTSSRALALIAQLELKGLIRNIGGSLYALNR